MEPITREELHYCLKRLPDANEPEIGYDYKVYIPFDKTRLIAVLNHGEEVSVQAKCIHFLKVTQQYFGKMIFAWQCQHPIVLPKSSCNPEQMAPPGFTYIPDMYEP